MDPATRRFLERGTAPGSHLGLIPHDDDHLAATVSQWAADSLRGGGGALLVGTTPHLAAIRKSLGALGIDLAQHERSGHAVVVEAEWLLAKFMIDGTPERSAFRPLLEEILSQISARVGSPQRICAWGEMVSLLRNDGRQVAARQLERLWDDELRERGFRLLCSYQPEPGKEATAALRHEVMETHDHVHADLGVRP